jgi:hypothetical protein
MNLFRSLIALFHFNRTNWKAVALCLLAASVFWLFNALNKNYSTNVRFPVEFEFDRREYAPARPLPNNILINVNGNGWDLFRKYFGIRVPVLTIPLESPTETRKIVASTLPAIFMPQMGGLNINFIVMDTLRLRIENRFSKKFKLRAVDDEVSYKDDMGRISPIVVLPDSVELNGPYSILSSLADTLVLNLRASRVDKDFLEQVEVELKEQEFVKRNPPVVEVRFEVGRILSFEQGIPLVTDKFPWGVVAGRDSVDVEFKVPEKYMDQFRSAPIRGLIDLSEMKKGEVRSFLPGVFGVPSFAEVVHIDSVRVKRY